MVLYAFSLDDCDLELMYYNYLPWLQIMEKLLVIFL